VPPDAPKPQPPAEDLRTLPFPSPFDPKKAPGEHLPLPRQSPNEVPLPSIPDVSRGLPLADTPRR
jgi:hypothetical protein